MNKTRNDSTFTEHVQDDQRSINALSRTGNGQIPDKTATHEKLTKRLIRLVSGTPVSNACQVVIRSPDINECKLEKYRTRKVIKMKISKYLTYFHLERTSSHGIDTK